MLKLFRKCRLYFVSVLILSATVNSSPGLAKQEFASFEIQAVTDEAYLTLDGQIKFDFSRSALEALDNGLPVVLVTEIELAIPNEWFWDRTIWEKTYSHEIQYHALSQQYLVKDVQEGFPRAYLTQSSALEALGQIDTLRLLEREKLSKDKSYIIRLKTSLDSESLPIPLRPLTYLSDAWRMESGWQKIYWQDSDKNEAAE